MNGINEIVEFKIKMKLPKKCYDCLFAHIEDGPGEWDVYDWCQFPNEYGDADKIPLSNGRNGMSDWCPIRKILNEENKE